MEQGLIGLVISICSPRSTLCPFHTALGSRKLTSSGFRQQESLAIWCVAEVGQWEGRQGRKMREDGRKERQGHVSPCSIL